ncbi:MAG: hypothetical protein J5809_01195 [Selenomonadaceae bacterium]|nr:hypothetical protein [Selenomonadaceae bacterium]
MSATDLAKRIILAAFGEGRLYEFLRQLWHGIRYEERGEFVIVHQRGRTASVRLKLERDFSLKLPLDFRAEVPAVRIAAVVHIFYVELAGGLKNLLANIPARVDVYISTTDAGKKSALEKVFADFDKGKVTVKVFENRGRDVAPLLVGFREIYSGYDLCLHLHSKKSPHDLKLAGWGEFLYKNLLGSTEIVAGILRIMARRDVGIVFPQYFSAIRSAINWGGNFQLAQEFAMRLGISLDERWLVEFPSGSMFWFKPQALAPLLNCGLSFEDFPPEKAQTDGTLAHALERILLYVAEREGFRYVKISADADKISGAPVLTSNSVEELNANVEKVCRRLAESGGLV